MYIYIYIYTSYYYDFINIKPSKIKSVMKWWSKCISMVIAKIASRNVACKLTEIVFAGQSVIQTRQVATEGLLSDDADFEDLGRKCGFVYF